MRKINYDDVKSNRRRLCFITIRKQNYDDFLLVFCNNIFVFIINDQGKTSSLVSYDEYENLVIER
jgi:hypothetical protein